MGLNVNNEDEDSYLLKAETASLKHYAAPTESARFNPDDHGDTHYDAKGPALVFSATGDALSEQVNPEHTVFREIFFVVMPMFCGYAALFSLQSQVALAMGIVVPDDKNDPNYDHMAHREKIFGFAVSFLYLGNLIFRLGHNFVFYFAYPRVRVLISMGAMLLSMLTLVIVLFVSKTSTNISAIFIAYGLGGVAVGSFESNVLSSITVLGKDTKLYAIIAMPVGVNTITIGAYLLMGAFTFNPGYVHLFVMAFLCVGVGVFLIRIFKRAKFAANFSIKAFLLSYKEFEWMKIISWNCLSLMIDMFAVSLFSPGIIAYIYNKPYVSLNWFGWCVNHNYYISAYNTCFFLGDTLSRKIFYEIRLVFPPLFLILTVIGICIGLSDQAEIVPLCAFLVAFANGSIYTQTNRKIDKLVQDRLNLVAISTWLFIGDMGSFIGSNVSQFIVLGINYNTVGTCCVGSSNPGCNST